MKMTTRLKESLTEISNKNLELNQLINWLEIELVEAQQQIYETQKSQVGQEEASQQTPVLLQKTAPQALSVQYKCTNFVKNPDSLQENLKSILGKNLP